MELFENCPDCGKQLSKSKKYCSCGWKIAQIIEQKPIDRTCHYPTEKGPCTYMGSIAPYGCGGKWYCSKHWYEAMQKEKNPQSKQQEKT